MIKNMMIWLLRLYRRYVSPLKGRSVCIYVPTCSLYALQSYEKYGFIKASYLTIRRVLRCHPFARGGYDPVP